MRRPAQARARPGILAHRRILPATALFLACAAGCGGGDRALSTGQTVGSGEASDGDVGTSGDAGTSDDAGTSGGVTSGGTASSQSGASDSDAGEAGDIGTDPVLDCTEDGDCVLFDDCEFCVALHVDDPLPPGSPIPCAQTFCASYDITAATCAGGVCDFVRAPCDPLEVFCDGLPPDCLDGTLPGVASGCWSGVCVPAHLCDVVPSCDQCGPAEVCLETVTPSGLRFSCRPRPTWCDADVDCECAESLCGLTYDVCQDVAPSHLRCSCEDC